MRSLQKTFTISYNHDPRAQHPRRLPSTQDAAALLLFVSQKVAQGRPVIITGEAGSGKTTLAISVLRSFPTGHILYLRRYENPQWTHGGLNPNIYTVQVEPVPTLKQRIPSQPWAVVAVDELPSCQIGFQTHSCAFVDNILAGFWKAGASSASTIVTVNDPGKALALVSGCHPLLIKLADVCHIENHMTSGIITQRTFRYYV